MPKDHEKRAAFGVILWAVYEPVITTNPLQINTLKAIRSRNNSPTFHRSGLRSPSPFAKRFRARAQRPYRGKRYSTLPPTKTSPTHRDGFGCSSPSP